MELVSLNLFKTIDLPGAITLKEGDLRILQKVFLSMSDDILDVANECSVPCLLSSGSALGAVRHQGFIPWDDDMDLMIPREHMDRFIDCFRNKYPDKYTVCDPRESNNGDVSLILIRKKGTKLKNHLNFCSKEHGIAIDVFPVENVPDNPIIRKIHGLLSMAVAFAVSCRRLYRDKDFIVPLVENNEVAKRSFSFKIFLGRLTSFASLDSWIKLANKVNSACSNTNSKYVTIPTSRGHYFGEMQLRSDFYPPKTISFEGRLWKIPNNVEKYLENLYGDWRRIPPIEEREKHPIFEMSINE